MKANLSVQVEKRISSKSGKEYIAAFVDVGYRKLIISVNPNDIAELLGISVAELYNRLKS